MRHQTHIARFLTREDGSLLVFFSVSVITILGIIALSFDLGRRASTQTDMQGYVDNVVLAAAGELDGSPNAIVNATTAANTVIAAANERLKAGTAGQDFTIALDQIVFYEDLPDTDAPASFDPAQLSNPASASYKYGLPPTDLGATPDPERARYVGIRLATVDVSWIFAGIFSASDLPDEAIGAVAIAGRSPWTCDIAPIAICLPIDSGEPQELNAGQGIRLRTSRTSSQWQEGEFGFASVDLDPSGNCAGLTTESGRQACLVNVQERISACMRPDRINIETGQRPSQEYAAFDMSFDIYEESTIQFFNNAFYAPSPHAVKGYVPLNSSSSQICAPTRRSPDTMAFPLDDCDSGPSGCFGSLFGDGDWDDGREDYVQTNYSLPDAEEEEIEDGYPFFDFPQPNLTRYQYYLLEIERAAGGGIMLGAGLPPYTEDEHLQDNDGGRGTGSPEDPLEDYETWDDFWPDDRAVILPHENTASRRFDNGLPQCNSSGPLPADPGRRVLLAAGIHCPIGAGALVGNETDVEVVDYYRVFQLSLTENFTGVGSTFDLPVEVIERVDPSSLGTYREVVQLYR